MDNLGKVRRYIAHEAAPIREKRPRRTLWDTVRYYGSIWCGVGILALAVYAALASR